MKKVIIIGSGGHAKVVIDIINEINKKNKDIDIIGITSKSLSVGELFFGLPVLGNDDIIEGYRGKENYFLAMGLGGFKDNFLREKVFNAMVGLGMRFLNVIHPSAVISETVVFGQGVTIFPGVILNTEVEIGDNTIIATGSSIDHETIIEENVLVSAGVTVGAYAIIGKRSLIALGANVVSGVKIGVDVLVAAGAVVVNDISDNKKVFGIPAKEKMQ